MNTITSALVRPEDEIRVGRDVGDSGPRISFEGVGSRAYVFLSEDQLDLLAERIAAHQAERAERVAS